MNAQNKINIEIHASHVLAGWMRYGMFSSPDNSQHYPCKKTIEKTIALLIEEFFPGLTTERNVPHDELFSNAVRFCSLVATDLGNEIRKSFGIGGNALIGEKLEAKTSEVIEAFLGELPRVLELVNTDIEAARRGDPAAKSKQEVIIAYPSIRAVTTYRLAHALSKLNVPFIPRIMTEWAHSNTGIDIHPGAVIGRGFFIDHGTGVVVGETVVIGENVRLYQGVTLGARSLSSDKISGLRGAKRHPTVGDNCIIYANAAVLGNILIGENSTIGANAIIVDPVAPYSFVVPPGKPPIVFTKRQPEPVDDIVRTE